MRIRDPGGKKFGSGINIPDPQHCFCLQELIMEENIFYMKIEIFADMLSSQGQQLTAILNVTPAA